MTRIGLGRLASAAIALALAATVATSSSWTSTSRHGDERGELRVDSAPAGARFTGLSPGDAAHWTHRVSLVGAESGRFSVRLSGSGALVEHEHGLVVSVSACARDYRRGPTVAERPRCGGDESVVVGPRPLRELRSRPEADSTERAWRLDDLRADAARSILVTLELPRSGASDPSLMELRADVGVGFYAEGSSPEPTEPPDLPDADLPSTGGPRPDWMLAGLGLIGCGAAALLIARRRGVRR